MPKGSVGKGSAEMFQEKVEAAAETLQRTWPEMGDRQERNLQVKEEMATELAAMGFPKRIVDRVLNMRMKEKDRGKKTSNKREG
jgi:hypothetical protein